MADPETPTKLSAATLGGELVQEGPRDFGFLLTQANLYRALDTITLVQRDAPWLPGQFVTAAGEEATAANSIAGINARGVNTSAGPRAALVVVRDAEVTDAYLHFGEMDPVAVATQLATLGIIMRQAVLPNVQGGSFDPNAPGRIQSGIPAAPPPEPPETLAYPQRGSYAPDTLQAAEPEKQAAGAPQPAPPTEPPSSGSTGGGETPPAGGGTPPPSGTP